MTQHEIANFDHDHSKDFRMKTTTQMCTNGGLFFL